MRTRAIGLRDVESAALRSLLTARGFSKAGLTINDSAAQTVTVTVGGVKHTDDVLTVTINGTDYAYTVLAGDADLAAVATALAAVIDADGDVAAAAVAEVITITASDAAAAFTVSAAVTGADNTTTLEVETTHVSVQSVETDNTFSFGIGGHNGSVAATADIVTTGEVLPISSFRWYLVVVGTTGAMTSYPMDDNVAALPEIPDNTAPVGCFKVVTDATHTFTPGVTALNATGITTTFYDLSCVPKAGVPA